MVPSPVSASSGVTEWESSGAAAQDLHDEDGGLAGLVLQVGEQGGDGVKLEAVDAEDLVVGLEAGAGGGHVGLERVDLDRRVLHLGDEAELVEGEVVGAALGFDEDLVSVRWPSWTKEKGMVWLRLRTERLTTSSQVGFSTVSKWTMRSPELDAGLGGGVLAEDVVGDGGAV